MAHTLEKGVLIVEDDEDLRDLFAALLELEHFRVYQAHDGPTGIEVLRKNLSEISLVITDLSLPNMGGIELISRVRSVSPGAKIIATSGLSGVEVQTMVLAAGATEFIPKPFAVQDVVRRVRAVMSLAS